MNDKYPAGRSPAFNTDIYEEAVLAEQVRQLYALAPFGFMATAMNSLIVFFVMREVMSYRIFDVWLAAMLMVTLLRVAVVLRFRNIEFRHAEAHAWGDRFIAGLALSGIAWGSLGFLPLSGISIAYQVFVAFVLGGMAAGAATTFSALKGGYLAYSVPALTPLALHFFLLGRNIHHAMGVMLFLYGFILWKISLHNYHINRTSLLLRFENRGMIDHLEGAQKQLLREIDAKLKAEAELRAHRDRLERVVEERTTDLVRANEQLKAEVEERKQAEQALRESEGRLALAQKAGRVGVFDSDLITRKIIWTEQMEELYGLPPGGFEGNYEGWAKRVHPDDLTMLEAQFRKWMQEHCRQVEFEYRFIRVDGQARWMRSNARISYLADGTPARMIGTNVDTTERKRMEEEITHLAHHDILTGLPNRRLFMDIVTIELAQARRTRHKLALLFLDLDRFKEVNDTFGHEAGDELLKEVSKRIRSGIRESDAAARIGGDEFNIILTDIPRAEDITLIARKIMDSLKKSFTIAGYELHITTSIGISVYPDDSEQIDTLYRYADIAMYHAKERGRNTFQFYNPGINIRSIEKVKFESYLRQTLDRGELVVHYQPQFDIKTNSIICAEALVRWQHPELGLLEPKRFIPLAEEIGFITAIDEWVLKTACSQVKSWQDAGLPFFCITVNLSSRAFRSPELADTILGILKKTGLTSEYLDIEITETLAMSNVEHTIARLNELTAMGVHISIDDFGTGYSSLNYLKRLPIHKLKIDQSFVRDIVDDPDDRAIINAVTAMAHSMRIKVIAEGVETEGQLLFLRETSCDEAQGYLFSRPLPAGEFRELMAAG